MNSKSIMNVYLAHFYALTAVELQIMFKENVVLIFIATLTNAQLEIRHFV